MPPITSSRPGARLIRIGRAKSNAPSVLEAANSARVRDRSVGTGSRLRSSRAGSIEWLRWRGCHRRWRRGGRIQRLAFAATRPFDDHAVEEASAAAQLKIRCQDVRTIRLYAGILELKTISAA